MEQGRRAIGAGAHVVEAGLGDARLRRRVGAAAVFALARIAAGHGVDRDLAGHRVVRDRELGRLQALDLVAQPGGGLEFEVAGRLAHLGLEVGDRGLEVVADLRRVLRKTLVDRDVVALVDRVEDVADLAAHAFGRDAVRRIVGELLLAPPGGLGHGALHRAGLVVGVEDHLAVDVSGRAADGLHQRGLGAQETFLVGVQDRDQRAFRDVEALAQEVDADQRVEGAEAQVADDLDALERVDVGVHVAHPHAVLVEILGEILRHALGQHGDQRAVALGGDLLDLAQQVVDLGAGGADLDLRVDEAGRADDLLGEHAAGLLHLP